MSSSRSSACTDWMSLASAILRRTRSCELVFTLFHIDLPPTKAHALSFQSQALFDGGITSQLDFSPGAEDSLPG